MMIKHLFLWGDFNLLIVLIPKLQNIYFEKKIVLDSLISIFSSFSVCFLTFSKYFNQLMIIIYERQELTENSFVVFYYLVPLNVSMTWLSSDYDPFYARHELKFQS